MATGTTSSGEVFAGGGEMGDQMRAIAWEQTPLGPIDRWPQSLRTALSICLLSRFPMAIGWGPSYAMLYNDAYAPILGTKHPWAIGRPCFEVWSELAHIVKPMFDSVISTGVATWSDDLMLPMLRHGYLEEAYFTVSYSAIRGESDRPEGVFITVTETTDRFLAERRLSLVRELGHAAGAARSPDEVAGLAGAILSQHTADVPFSLAYGIDAAKGEARLQATTGIEPDHPAAIVRVSLADAGPWPIGLLLDGRDLHPVELDGPPLPGGAWPDPARFAVLLPISGPGRGDPIAALVCGVNPRRALDERHCEFFRLVAGQIANAIANGIAHEESRKRAEVLAELDRAKTAFFSNVSHEFRTPLTLMLGPTDDLLAGVHGEIAEAQRAQLELLRRNQLRLQRLVNALLEFSRIEAGRAQACYEATDLGSFTREVASAFESAIERAGLGFVLDCPPTPEPIFIDRNMWEQIVLNLLSNAFKFTFEGEIAVSLASASEGVVLRVRDTGVGIHADEMPRLFERFHRVEGSRARTHEGSGIGLALVQELVRLHGGTIQAESSYGAGTSFTITIPRGSAHLPADRLGRRDGPRSSGVAASFVEEAARWSSKDESAAGSSSATGRRILVADDNADMRAYLRKILEDRWIVETVSDGEAAFSAARERPPDLILSDVMMPLLDGFKLLQRLRRDPKTQTIPVILLSARAGEESRIEGLQAGADDYLVKPFSARELVARVNTQLKLKEALTLVDRQLRDATAILRHAPVAISLFAMPERRHELVNDAHVALLGRDVTGLDLDRAYPALTAEERARWSALHDQVLASGEPATISELADPRPDGSIRWFQGTMGPWHAQDGTLRGVVSVLVDITERITARRQAAEAEEEIRRSQAELRRALELRDEFLSLASHELRTPLTTLGFQIDGLLRAIQQAPVDGGRERSLERAEKLRAQCTRLEHLIEDMMNVVGWRQEESSSQQPEALDLLRIAQSVVATISADSKLAKETISVRGESTKGRWVRHRLEQVLMRLLANALKFGGEKPIDVHVTGDASTARISITDRGVGIASSDQERIFKRFERAVPSEHYGGFGLGLWIVSELVAAMSGRIRVESAPGEGATFVVQLPRET